MKTKQNGTGTNNEAEGQRDDPKRRVTHAAGRDLCCDGRSMPPTLTERTACPGLQLLSCELLANPAAVANVLDSSTECTKSFSITQVKHGSKLQYKKHKLRYALKKV